MQTTYYTSRFGPRDVIVGSVAINASSQSFMALCTSLRWPHLGCLITPAAYSKDIKKNTQNYAV